MDDWALPLNTRPLPNLGRRRRPSPHSAEAAHELLRQFVLLAVGVDAARRFDAPLDPDELALVRRMGEPGSNAARDIYERYADRIFRFLYRRLDEQVEDAEDLTLETFTTAVHLASGFDGRSSVFGWLCGIAKVRLIDHHRRLSRGKRTSPNGTVSIEDLAQTGEIERFGSGSFEEILDRITAREMVDAALAQLNPHEREALILFYVEEFSVRDIAAHMGRTEKAVGSLLSRAKAKPRDFLLRLMADGEAGHA